MSFSFQNKRMDITLPINIKNVYSILMNDVYRDDTGNLNPDNDTVAHNTYAFDYYIRNNKITLYIDDWKSHIVDSNATSLFSICI